jgi:DNA-binding XRE family transcriptional regulator
MIVKYNKETGLMYLHFVTGTPNIQMPTANEEISKFVSKANRELVVGYEIENIANNLDFVLNKIGLSRKQKLAVVMCYIRENLKKTQKEFSTIINVSESTYKSIERAEHNIQFDTLDIIYNQFSHEKALHAIF